jgi:SAM-dependent methyltransferase
MKSDLLELRSLEPELMDGEDYTPEEFLECLRQMRTINTLTDGYRPTLKALAEFARDRGTRSDNREPLRVLDIGSGYGDTLREIAQWARQSHVDVELAGIDINPLAGRYAEEATPKWMRIRYMIEDIFEHRPPQPYDVIISGLFMHHLRDAQIVRLLRWQAAHARLGFFINDLHRHPLAFQVARHLTRIFNFNRLIRHDAPLSVARAFRAEEWSEYIRLAGLERAGLRVEWHWSFRYGIRYAHAS